MLVRRESVGSVSDEDLEVRTVVNVNVSSALSRLQEITSS